MDTTKCSILYVDDEKNSLSAFKNLFRKKFNIIPANSAKEGLGILESQSINLIIADQRMPEMTGIEFLKKVRKKRPDLKFILLTAFTEIEVIKEAINDVGIYWYINKPFDPEQMEQLITKAIEADRADLLLKESEEKFRGVFNSMENVFSRSDLDGNCIMISPSVFNLLGYKPEEIIGEKLSGFYANPDQRATVVEKLRRSKKVERFEIELLKKDGGSITVSASAKIYYDDDGNPLGIEGLFSDITERNLAEDKLRESEKRFRATFEQAAVGIAHVSPDGRFLRINEKFCEIVGYSQDEMLISDFQRITHPDDLGKDLALVQGLMKGEANAFSNEKRYIRKDGNIVWVALSTKLLRNETFEPDYFVTVVVDITDKKYMEEVIMESGKRFRTLSDASSEAIFFSEKGICIEQNSQAEKMFGYTLSEAIGRKGTDWIVPEDHEMVINKLVSGDNSTPYETTALRKDGSTFPAEIHAKMMRFDGREVRVTILKDITAHKKAESEHNKLFNYSFDLLAIANFDGYFTELNPAWENVTGYSINELKKEPFIDFIHKDDCKKTNIEIEKLITGKSTLNFQNRYKKKNGDFIHLAWTATPMSEEKLLYCIARDVTEQIEAEREVIAYQDRLKSLTQELTISEEKVRKQIAVDLHDNVGQLLSSSRMQLATVLDLEEDPEITIRLKSISQALLKTIQTTREAIFNLSPPQLNEIGLYAALHDWIHEQIEKKYDISTSITGENVMFDLEENTRILIFRSVTELMMNVLKHARAKQLVVDLKIKGRMLEIKVEDDGDGFNYNADHFKFRSDSYGLFSIHERLSDLKGSLTIDSVIDKGTIARISVPLKNKV